MYRRVRGEAVKLLGCKEFYYNQPAYAQLCGLYHQLRNPISVDSTQATNRSVADMTRIANFMQKVENRIFKYGLQFPILERDLSKADCQQLEQQVYDRMVAAMRPQPSPQPAAED
jgi:hypothetical protein